MPFDLSEVVNDPDLGQPITILRTVGGFVAGGWQGQAQSIPAFGVVAPADSEALAQVPEGDRVIGSLQCLCSQQIFETQAQQSGVSDKIEWRGSAYRVIAVQPWGDFGFWSAILVRLSGE